MSWSTKKNTVLNTQGWTNQSRFSFRCYDSNQMTPITSHKNPQNMINENTNQFQQWTSSGSLSSSQFQCYECDQRKLEPPVLNGLKFVEKVTVDSVSDDGTSYTTKFKNPLPSGLNITHKYIYHGFSCGKTKEIENLIALKQQFIQNIENSVKNDTEMIRKALTKTQSFKIENSLKPIIINDIIESMKKYISYKCSIYDQECDESCNSNETCRSYYNVYGSNRDKPVFKWKGIEKDVIEYANQFNPKEREFSRDMKYDREEANIENTSIQVIQNMPLKAQEIYEKVKKESSEFQTQFEAEVLNQINIKTQEEIQKRIQEEIDNQINCVSIPSQDGKLELILTISDDRKTIQTQNEILKEPQSNLVYIYTI